MRIFVTGSTGFVGSALVPELIAAGHKVLGLSRSDAGAQALTSQGAEVLRGDVNDTDVLKTGVERTDGLIHTAFDHDFSKLKENSEKDRRVIEALGAALAGSDRPFIVTSGTGLVRSKTGAPAVETDGHVSSKEFARAASEEAADTLMEQGKHIIVLRLPQVHDESHQGRIAQHIHLARKKGRVAYVGEGNNRLPAVHITDAVRAFRLAFEKGQPGSHFHVVAEEGVPFHEIADVIGKGLELPVESIRSDEAEDYFGWLAKLAQQDLAASGKLTQEQLDWHPTGPGLLTDLRKTDYSSF